MVPIELSTHHILLICLSSLTERCATRRALFNIFGDSGLGIDVTRAPSGTE